MKSIVSEKGQVTIPKQLRDSLGIGPGTTLDFVEENGTLVARRLTASDPLAALVGMLAGIDVDRAIDDMRGPGWNPEQDEHPRGHGGR